MAPEYVMRGQFSTKSDVYSFGVLVLEIVSGQSITSFSKENNAESLVTQVSPPSIYLVAKVIKMIYTSNSLIYY